MRPSTKHINDDIQLVTDAQAGNSRALNTLAVQVCQKLYPVLYGATRDYHLTHDLLQDTLLVMLKFLNNLNNAERFWGWIYKVAANKVYDHFRKQAHRDIPVVMEMDTIADLENFYNGSPPGHLMNRERNESLVYAIRNLKKQYREVVYLRDFEHRPYAEIASMYRCSGGQVRSRHFRAKKLLRKHLCATGYGPDE